MSQVGILISGRGSNMVALLDAMDRGEIPARCSLVISNKADAPGLALAAARGVPTLVIDHKASATREEHDAKVVTALREAGVEIVCLAGYMRRLTPLLVGAYAGRMLNIHPSLLPAFPGLDTHARALAAGVKLHGCTVHLVTEALDEGPILAQAAVPVRPGDTEATLAARVLAQEHRLYPLALALLARGEAGVAADAAASLVNPLPEAVRLA